MVKDTTIEQVDFKRLFDHREYLNSLGYSGFDDVMANPADEMVWRSPTKDHFDNAWIAFREMGIKDPYIGALTKTFIDAIVQLDRHLDYDDCVPEVEKWWEELLSQPRDLLEVVIRTGAWSVANGAAGAEVLWEEEYPGARPTAAIRIPNHWWKVDSEGNVYRVKKDRTIDKSEPLDPRRFLCFLFDADMEFPYGRGFLLYCFWPFTFKKQTILKLLDLLDRHINPKIIVTAPHGAHAAGSEIAAGISRDIISVNAGAETKITPLQLQGNAGAITYIKTIQYWDKMIARAIVGGDLVAASGDDGRGSYALSKTHEAQFALRKAVAARYLQSEVQSRFINMVNTVRFGKSVVAPKLFIDIGISEDLKDRADVDNILRGNKSIEEMFGPEYIEDTYRRPVAEVPGPGTEGDTGEGAEDVSLAAAEVQRTARLATNKVIADVAAGSYIRDEIYEELRTFSILRTTPLLKDYETKFVKAVSGRISKAKKTIDKFAAASTFAGDYGLQLTNEIMTAYVIGWALAAQRIPAAMKETATVSMADDPLGNIDVETLFGVTEWEEIAEILQSKIPISMSEFRELEKVLKPKYISFARVKEEELLIALRDLLAEALSSKEAYTTAQFIEAAEKLFIDVGLSPLNPSHATTIYRTSMVTAHEAAQEDFIEAGDFPGLKMMLITAGDDRVRDNEKLSPDGKLRGNHKVLHGLVMEAVVWYGEDVYGFSPAVPNGYNERCALMPLLNDSIKVGTLPENWAPDSPEFEQSPASYLLSPVRK